MKVTKLPFLGLLMCCLIFFSQFASAVGLGVKAGTLGLGLEASFALSNHVGLRLGVTGGKHSEEFDNDGINYDGAIEFSSQYLFLDWHLFRKGNWRLSVGAIKGIEISATGRVNGRTKIGNADVDSGNVILNGKLTSTAPYVGLGWGNAVEGFPLKLSIDLGVAFGDPEVNLQVNNARLNGQPVDVSDQVAAEQREFEKEELDDFEFYPVVQVGLSYQF